MKIKLKKERKHKVDTYFIRDASTGKKSAEIISNFK